MTYNSLPIRVSILLVLLFSAAFCGTSSAQTWLGLTADWNTASNWNTAAVPIAGQTATIPAGTPNDPVINGAVPDLGRIDIQSTATLTIAFGGSVHLDGGGVGTGVNLRSSSVLTVHGTLTGEDFLLELILINTNALLDVRSSGLVEGSDLSGCFLDVDGGTVTNDGIMRLLTSTNDGMEIKVNSTVTNNCTIEMKWTGVVSTSIEGIKIEGNNGSFTNNGYLKIEDFDDGIEVNNVSGAVFENNGRIDISGSVTQSIVINAASHNFNNNAGGIITMQNQIDNGGIINNDGFLQAGSSINNTGGTFNNNAGATICDQSSIFPPATGTYNNSGSVLTVGCAAAAAVPCSPAPPTIPTIGEWGLFLLAISILIVGLVGAYNTNRLQQLAGVGNVSIDSGMNVGPLFFPFERTRFAHFMKYALMLVPIGFMAIYFFWGEVVPVDFIGMAVTVPMVAYVLFLLNRNK